MWYLVDNFKYLISFLYKPATLNLTKAETLQLGSTTW